MNNKTRKNEAASTIESDYDVSPTVCYQRISQRVDVNLAPAQTVRPGLTPVPGFIVVGTATNMDLRVAGSIVASVGAPFIAVHGPGVAREALQELLVLVVGRR